MYYQKKQVIDMKKIMDSYKWYLIKEMLHLLQHRQIMEHGHIIQ